MFSDDQIQLLLEKTVKDAEVALQKGNYPISSLITDKNGKILVSETNLFNTNNDITAHAEILCIRKLGNTLNNYINDEHYLFSSLEPCYGCSFFIARTNISTIYSALKDPHKGGISDLKSKHMFFDFFHKLTIVNEPFENLKNRSKELMRNYFNKIGKKENAKYYQ